MKHKAGHKVDGTGNWENKLFKTTGFRRVKDNICASAVRQILSFKPKTLLTVLLFFVPFALQFQLTDL